MIEYHHHLGIINGRMALTSSAYHEHGHAATISLLSTTGAALLMVTITAAERELARLVNTRNTIPNVTCIVDGLKPEA